MIGVSIIGSLVAFVLVTLALFSGKQQGFMEDYNIITVRESFPHPLTPRSRPVDVDTFSH